MGHLLKKIQVYTLIRTVFMFFTLGKAQSNLEMVQGGFWIK